MCSGGSWLLGVLGTAAERMEPFTLSGLPVVEFLPKIEEHYENSRNGEVYRDHSSKNVHEIAICWIVGADAPGN